MPPTHQTSDRRSHSRARSQRRLLINPKFQGAFLGFMTTLALLCTGVGYWISRHFMHAFETRALELGIEIDHPLFALLTESRNEMTQAFLGFAVIVWFALWVGGLLVSHWIAGPLYRLMTHMNRLVRENASQESLHPLKFRRSDFFPELAEVYNRVLAIVQRQKK